MPFVFVYSYQFSQGVSVSPFAFATTFSQTNLHVLQCTLQIMMNNLELFSRIISKKTHFKKNYF